MKELKGKYTFAKIFTDNVEDEAVDLVKSLVNHPAFENVPIRCMPDCHAGKGITIGFTAPLSNYVNPSHVGCDIGCTVSSVFYNKSIDKSSYQELEHKVRLAIPSGFDINPSKVFDDKEFYKFMNSKMSQARSAWPEMVYQFDVNEKSIRELLQRVGMNVPTFYDSLGTIGGGNHFLELGKDPEGNAVWTIHCGSRNFGLKVFNYWNRISQSEKLNKTELREGIEKIKQNCTDKTQLQRLIKEFKDNIKSAHPTGYLYGENMKGYLTDVFFCQAYASWNHEVIKQQLSKIMDKMFGASPIGFIQSIHNYINPIDHIIRKGAITSYEGQKMIIPFNMRDGLAICEGKSNPDWNYSAPHGAGRILSRSKAKENISIEAFEKSMEGIYSTSVCEGTLDESPMAYKDMDEIIKNIQDTAKILYFIKPEINIKATDSIE
jgi:RNA-splicing ligase RtcB